MENEYGRGYDLPLVTHKGRFWVILVVMCLLVFNLEWGFRGDGSEAAWIMRLIYPLLALAVGLEFVSDFSKLHLVHEGIAVTLFGKTLRQIPRQDLRFFGVENIIRVGSAGSIQDHVNLYDIVIGQGACTDSGWAKQFHLPGTFAPIANFDLVCEAVKACEAYGATYHVGNINSSDVFYGDHVDVPEGLDSVYGLKKMGVLALEMEAAAQ